MAAVVEGTDVLPSTADGAWNVGTSRVRTWHVRAAPVVVPTAVWLESLETAKLAGAVAWPGIHRPAVQRAAVQVPGHPASSYEFGQQMDASGGWLTAAGLVGLALEVADHFLDRD